jgi:dihydrofolate reductase
MQNMPRVRSDISVSLDGFIAGPDEREAQPLGEGGLRLHQWMFDLPSWREPHSVDPRTGDPFADGSETNPSDAVVAEQFARLGAVVMGRRMFDGGEGPWGENPPYHVPVFIVTHRARETVTKEGGTTYTFVTDGVASAVVQAKAAAGDNNVWVPGGAQIIRELLQAGMLDEVQIHLVPVLLGQGRRLFDQSHGQVLELECTRVIASPGVTHLRYRPVR